MVGALRTVHQRGCLSSDPVHTVWEAGSDLLGEDRVTEPTDGCEAPALPQKHKSPRIPKALLIFFFFFSHMI